MTANEMIQQQDNRLTPMRRRFIEGFQILLREKYGVRYLPGLDQDIFNALCEYDRFEQKHIKYIEGLCDEMAATHLGPTLMPMLPSPEGA